MDYTNGRYIISHINGPVVGMLDHDEYIRNRGELVARVDGDEVYSLQGQLLGRIGMEYLAKAE